MSDPVPPDSELVERVLAGETDRFEPLLRRYNQRVYRVVRSVLRDEFEIEEVMQQAYVSAFEHLRDLVDRNGFGAWVSRIARNEALVRVRRAGTAPETELEDVMADTPDPERHAAARELHRLLEQAIDALPVMYRETLVLREVDGLSTAEAAAVLGVQPDVVKTRLHRARGLLEGHMEAATRATLPSLFRFEAPRCDRVVGAVMAILRSSGATPSRF